MFDWLKNINKEYPEFWKTYLSKFDIKSTRFVVLSTETSGLNHDKDVILSIGSFAVIDNSIVIGDSFEAVLLQYKFLHENGLSNDFLVENKMKKLGEPEAIKLLIEFIGNSILVGHHTAFEYPGITPALNISLNAILETPNNL